ncbi:unnamed protein product [Scytosiphon promiscuus]
MGQTLQAQRRDSLTYRQFQGQAAQFVLGNVVSIAIIIYEISHLDVCFDGNEDDDLADDDDEENAAYTRNLFVVALACGLVMEIVPFLSLSIIHRSLLDAKSAHKVPKGSSHCWSSFIARVFVPSGTGFIGILFGFVAIQYGFKKSCDGNGGSTSSLLLIMTGLLSMIFGAYICALFLLLSPCSCCEAGDHEAPQSSCGTCCHGIRGCVHTGLKYLWVVDTAWQLLSVVISYRAGTFPVGIAWLVAAFTASAEWRATAASLFVIAYESDVVKVMP